MASVVEICNRALAAIGSRSSISSLTENSKEARACNKFYSITLDRILRSADWGFAKKYATASLLKSAPGTPGNSSTAGVWTTAWPAPGWLYSYAYPSDCTRVRQITNQPYETTVDASVPIFSVDLTGPFGALSVANRFERGLDVDTDNNQVVVILTNVVQAILCYTARVTNPNLFDSSFMVALEKALAFEICLDLSGSPSLKASLAEEVNMIIMSARVADANEGLTVIDQVPDWLLTRGVFSNSPNIGYFAEPYSPLYGGL